MREREILNDSFYVRYGKRWFDVAASLSGLAVFSPVFFVAAIAVSLDSPGSPFFLQERIGKFEVSFRIIKFRSMRAAFPGGGPLITSRGDSRITRVGRWLRKTKVDELPQLLNVLRGDMSLVGPRPEVSTYTTLYNGEQKRVFKVRPGITGQAAVVYANEEALLSQQQDRERFYVETLMPAKLELDLAYCRSISFRNDLKLICRTFGRLLDRDQTSTDQSALLRGVSKSHPGITG